MLKEILINTSLCLIFLLPLTAKSAEQVEHTIRSHDEVMKISQIYYGTKKKYFRILKANPNLKAERLRVGDVIIIPNPLYMSEAESPAFEHQEDSVAAAPVVIPLKKSKKVAAQVKDETTKVQNLVEIVQANNVNVAEIEKNHKIKLAEIERVYAEKLNAINTEWERKNSELLAQIQVQVAETNKWKEKFLIVSAQRKETESRLKKELDQTQRENDKFQDLLAMATKHKAKMEDDFNDKIESLENKLSKSENETNRFQEKTEVLQARLDQLKDWKDEKDKFLNRYNDLNSENKRLLAENDSLAQRKDVFVSHQLVSTQEQILKEKSRILAERLWVEKNRSVSECKIEATQITKDAPKAEELQNILASTFGAKNFFIDPSENKIILRIPKNAILGVDKPRIRQSYQVQLSKVAGYLKNYSLSKAKLESQSNPKGEVMDENNVPQEKEFVELKQSKAILEYLSDKVFIPQTEVAMGKGSTGLFTKDNDQYFDLSLTFQEPIVNPALAGIEVTENSSNLTIENFLSDIKAKVVKNNKGSAEVKNGILEIDIPHDQIFGKNEQLLQSGKTKLNEIVSLFSTSSDVGVEVLWVPGQFDRGTQTNLEASYRDLTKIKNTISNDQKSLTERVSYFNMDGRDVYRDDSNPSNDRLKKRIIFRIVPYSLGVRFAKL